MTQDRGGARNGAVALSDGRLLAVHRRRLRVRGAGSIGAGLPVRRSIAARRVGDPEATCPSTPGPKTPGPRSDRCASTSTIPGACVTAYLTSPSKGRDRRAITIARGERLSRRGATIRRSEIATTESASPAGTRLSAASGSRLLRRSAIRGAGALHGVSGMPTPTCFGGLTRVASRARSGRRREPGRAIALRRRSRPRWPPRLQRRSVS